HYTCLAVVRENGRYYLQQRTGNWTKDNEVRTDLGSMEELGLSGDTIYLRMLVREEKQVSFEAGRDEEHMSPLGEVVEAAPGRWVGVKAGLFAINESGNTGGSVAADYFVFEKN
ncbi:MAG: hypothetical protein K2O57_05350, partial [Acetatifactor sp.]|nr:hypothetical protein [Acetatifactor sp.]